MKTISTITTQELERLEDQYRNPATLEESCILRGVRQEIKEREAFRKRDDSEDYKAKIETLENELTEKHEQYESERRKAELRFEKIIEIASED